VREHLPSIGDKKWPNRRRDRGFPINRWSHIEIIHPFRNGFFEQNTAILRHRRARQLSIISARKLPMRCKKLERDRSRAASTFRRVGRICRTFSSLNSLLESGCGDGDATAHLPFLSILDIASQCLRFQFVC
jgi:hypothetical protein